MSELDQVNPDFLAQLSPELSEAIIEDPLTLKRNVQKWSDLEEDLFIHILNQKVNQQKNDEIKQRPKNTDPPFMKKIDQYDRRCWDKRRRKGRQRHCVVLTQHVKQR